MDEMMNELETELALLEESEKDNVIVINLSHPITDEQKEQIVNICKNKMRLNTEKVERVINIPVHFDANRDFNEQANELVDKVIESVTDEDMVENIVIMNLPGHSLISAAVVLGIEHKFTTLPVLQIERDTSGITPKFYVKDILWL